MYSRGRTGTTRLLRVVRPALSGATAGATVAPAPLFAAVVAADAKVAFLVGVATAIGVGLARGVGAAFEDDGGIQSHEDPARRGVLAGCAAFLAAALPVVPFGVAPGAAFAPAFLLLAVVLGVVAGLRARYAGADAVEAAVRVVLVGAVAAAVGAGLGGL